MIRARAVLGFCASFLLGCTATPEPASPPVSETVERKPAGSPSVESPSDPSRSRVPEVSCADESGYCVEWRALSGSRDGSEKVRLARLIETEPERAEAYFSLARAYTREETFEFGRGGAAADKARVLLERAARLSPLPGIELELARVLLALGKVEEAEPLLARLGKKFPGEPEVQGALGVIHLAKGEVREALEPLGRAAILEPSKAERQSVLGSARLLAGDTSGAIEAFRKAIDLEPSSPKAHGNLGAALLLVGQLEEGKAHLERALELDPSRATSWTNLAHAHLLGKEPEKARDAAQRATALDPNFGSAWLNLGLSLAALGRFRDARDAVLEAKRLDATDPRPAELLREIDEAEAAAKKAPSRQ